MTHLELYKWYFKGMYSAWGLNYVSIKEQKIQEESESLLRHKPMIFSILNSTLNFNQETYFFENFSLCSGNKNKFS